MKNFLFLFIISFLLTGFSCNSGNKNSSNMQKNSAKEIIEKHSEEIMDIEGVVGLYEGQQENGRTCIKVMVKEKSPGLEDKIPKEIEGYPVIIEVTGEIKPL